MPRQINHLLKWYRVPHPLTNNKSKKAWRTTLTKTIHGYIAEETAGWSLTMWICCSGTWVRFGHHDTYETVSAAKGAICKQINILTAELVRAKQVADGVQMRSLRKKP